MATYMSSAGHDYWLSKNGESYSNKAAAVAADQAYDEERAAAAASIEAAELANKTTASKLQSSSSTSQLTSEFLSKWGEISSSAIEILQNAISGGTSTGDSDYDDLITSIKDQVAAYEENYGAAEQESVSTALQNIQAASSAVNTLKGLATADYEGEAGKAATDAKAQSEIQNKEAAKELMSYGVDPTSGKFGALTRKNALSTAKTTVESMNKARQAEKTRVGEAASELASTANSAASTASDLAGNLMSQKSDLLGLQTDAYNAKTSAETAKASTATSVAEALSSIGEQYGSLGSTLLGLYGTSGTNDSSSLKTGSS